MSYLFLFRCILCLLRPSLEKLVDPRKGQPGYVECLSNGPINLTICLAVTICFFVGGKAYGRAVVIGILHISVFDNIDTIVNTVNGYNEIDIAFPLDHTK